jgi:LuxR family maltose regulon positive regulatory protein
MPKAAPFALLWSPERDCYVLRGWEREHTRQDVTAGARRWIEQDVIAGAAMPAWWREWLAVHSSFSFQGQRGGLTLLKEPRERGAGYWYAYRSQDGRTKKRYAGRARDLSPARLEAIALAFMDPASPGEEREPDETTEDAEGAERTEVGPSVSRSHTLESPALIDERAREEVNPPLLAAKLTPPRPRADLIARAQPLARLDAALARRLTVLSAPAGFGKTTLAGQWVAAGATDSAFPAVAWLTLDAEDNEPARFWRYVITACQRIAPGIGRSALARLGAPFQLAMEPRPVELALASLLNDLARIGQPGLLILDDFQLIMEPRIHESFAALLEHLPPALRVVLLTRGEPPLPLARWRARDELSDLRAGDLRFSREETVAFFAQTLSVPLAEAATARLDPHLEGWPAGLRMVALAFERYGGEDVDPRAIEGLLANFTGSHRHILEYFVTEVLAGQSQLTQMFLLRTSVLSRMTGALCDEVAGGGDGARMLATLARANLFLEPLNEAGQWYRYHPLFAEAMRQEARTHLGEAALRACLRRASVWLEREGMRAEAIEAALDAEDMPRAAELIEALAGRQDFLTQGSRYALKGWLERLPTTLLEGHPILCFVYALVLAFTPNAMGGRDTAKIAGYLRLAERAWQAEGNPTRLGEAYAFHALLSFWQGEIVTSTDFARRALALLPEGEVASRSTSLTLIGAHELLEGRLTDAERTVRHALRLCQTTGNPGAIRATTLTLAEVFLRQGTLQRAIRLYRQVLADAADDPEDRARTLLGLALAAYEWNVLSEAASQALEARLLAAQVGDQRLVEYAELLLARIEHAQGRILAARRRLSALLAALPTSSRARLSQREVLAWQARMALAAGPPEAAWDWPSAAGALDGVGSTAEAGACAEVGQELAHSVGEVCSVALALDEIESLEELVRARQLLARGAAGMAIALLERRLPYAREQGHRYRALEIQLVLARAYAARGQTDQARERLEYVLSAARAEGYQRLFLDEGPALAGLLRALWPVLREPAVVEYARSLLAALTDTPGDVESLPPSSTMSSLSSPRALPAPSAPANVNEPEPLSAAERRVLRLLIAGHTRQEIAGELVISVNTVKTHLQHIYRKLGVTTRAGAIRAASHLVAPGGRDAGE